MFIFRVKALFFFPPSYSLNHSLKCLYPDQKELWGSYSRIIDSRECWKQDYFQVNLLESSYFCSRVKIDEFVIKNSCPQKPKLPLIYGDLKMKSLSTLFAMYDLFAVLEYANFFQGVKVHVHSNFCLQLLWQHRKHTLFIHRGLQCRYSFVDSVD